MNTELFLVTGASGKLGLSFIHQLKNDAKNVIGLTRKHFIIDTVQTLEADLLNESQIETAIKSLDFSHFKTIILIHPVGKFKFEAISSTTTHDIDTEVYTTNVITLKNIIKILSRHITPNQRLKICAFASISDKYNIPFWKSYTQSKNIMKGYLRDICREGCIDALVVNVSTVDTGNENTLRPNADKTYWLQPEEIVLKTLSRLDKVTSFEEIEVFKNNPNFNKNYYLNHEEILNKWEKEMGLKK